MPTQRARLLKGDCLDVLQTLEDGSVDALVTDPPAGIGFMGKEWDTFGQRGNSKAEADREAGDRGPGKGAQPFGYGQTASLAQVSKQVAKTRGQFLDFLTSRLAERLRVCNPGGCRSRLGTAANVALDGAGDRRKRMGTV